MIKDAYNKIVKVSGKLSKYIKETPLEYNDRLSLKYKCNIYFKREDLQNTKSFKIRGSTNKILNTYYKNSNEIITASAGNHAQGVANACNKLNIPCHIFVPENTPLQKIDKIRSFGGNNCNLYITGNTFDEALSSVYNLSNEKIMNLFIHLMTLM